MKLNLFFLWAGVALLALQAQAQDDWARNFRLGMLLGVNVKADFKTGGHFTLETQPGKYDDGYVLMDNTGNAGGLTGNWGYENQNQHDTPTTLMFHSSKSSDINGGVTSGRDD